MRQVFKDKALEDNFIKNGYCLVHALHPADVEHLNQIYQANRVEEQPAIERTTSSENYELAQTIRQQCGEIIAKRAGELLIDYKLLFSGFITKNPGKPTKMRLHQDPTFVDETQFKALNIWTPLVDVDENNGALWIVPNSDKFFSGFRGQPARAYDFADIAAEVMDKFGKMIPMKAGDSLIYDTSLFHFSFENNSGVSRIANATVMIPAEAVPVYYHHNQQLGTLDLYEVSEDFLLRHYSSYLKTGQVNEKLLSRTPYQPPRRITLEEFTQKYYQLNR